MTDFDVIIIGTGSGNTIITPEFDDLNIAIIEKSTFGGTCLNRGCIPSKMLIYVADVLTEIKRSGDLGITTENYSGNWQAIQERILAELIRSQARENRTDIASRILRFLMGKLHLFQVMK